MTTKLRRRVASQFQWSIIKRNVSILYIVIILFYLKVELIINCNKQELMIIKNFLRDGRGLLYFRQYYQMLVFQRIL